MKKIVSLILAAVLVLSLCAYAAADEAKTAVISLRIEGITECMYYDAAFAVPYETDDLSVLQVMQYLATTDDAPVIVYDEAGTYITGIGSDKAATDGSYAGWMYLINGISPAVGMSDQLVNAGDEIVFYYSDQFGIGFDVAQIDVSGFYSFTERGTVTFYAMREKYDENWTYLGTESFAIAGAHVVWNGETYVTDDGGYIMPPLAAGWATVQIEKYDDYTDDSTGLPLVLRFAPDYRVFVPFEDMLVDWYKPAIQFATDAGLFKGVAATRFAPDSTLSRGQLFVLLSRVAGETFAATGEFWYQEAYDWAVDNGIYAAGLPVAQDQAFADYIASSVSRAEVFLMLFKTIELLGTVDMEQRADITGATDYADLAERYVDAASWAVAADLIHGTDNDALTISPNSSVTRAQVCQMLYNYYA